MTRKGITVGTLSSALFLTFMSINQYFAPLGLFCAAMLMGASVQAQDATPESEPWNAKFQATYIWQKHPGFSAAYSGVNSLLPSPEKSYSFTSTAFLGLRLARGTELYFNPEAVQGVAFSGLTGLGGLNNSELQKTAGARLKLYRARLFVRQTWGLGGEREAVESEANQLGGSRDKNRVVLSAGNLAVSDLFDTNAYAHDGRTQLMNWSFLTHGAYDFAADARGYSWGAALEYFGDDWAIRAGRFAQPKEPNGLPLDFAIGRHYGDQLELEKSYELFGQPGKARLLVFRNHVFTGGFSDALANAAVTGGVPDTALVRRLRSKTGVGLNLEQALGSDVGAFARLARSNGETEVYAFAEIDRSLSVGTTIQGNSWGRPGDSVGLAYAQNGLTSSHQAFLAAGGIGFFVGDGRLNYRTEKIVEGYYSLGLPLLRSSALSLGMQYIRNPGYNADRGPVKVVSVRLHTEF